VRPRRVARRLLDPWAGLLVAALVVLAVVILLATPGPWRVVGGEDAPVTLATSPPTDVAVFVRGGGVGGRCTAAAWLHVEYEPADFTVTLVPARTRCPVPGGGWTPLGSLVIDLGPEPAAQALGDALGVAIDGWVTLDRAAAAKLLAAGSEASGGRQGRLQAKRDLVAVTTLAGDLDGLRRQHGALDRALHDLAFAEVKGNAVVNYVLGSGDAETDLDLRAATSLVAALRTTETGEVAVRTAAVVVETCGGVHSWRLDRSRLESLRLSLALGLEAPAAAPAVARRAVAAEVVLAAASGGDGEGLARDLEAALRAAGARPVDVRFEALDASGAAARLGDLATRRRPLAVVLLPAVTTAPLDTDAAARLTALAAMLGSAAQPAVVAAPAGAVPADALEAVVAAGLPVLTLGTDDAAASPSPSPSVAAPEDAVGRLQAAGQIAAAVARACWPQYLLPRAPATATGFGYAARRATPVTVAGATRGGLAAWLSTCGFAVSPKSGAGWSAPAAPAIAYQPGRRRAALAAAGDLGWSRSTLVLDAAAPAALTVVTTPD
jgi:hypothetical protein